jgi:hypothetical protein
MSKDAATSTAPSDELTVSHSATFVVTVQLGELP